jgi:hypothetical protein
MRHAVLVFAPSAMDADEATALHVDGPFAGIEVYRICADVDEADKLASSLIDDNPDWKIMIEPLRNDQG